MMSYTTTSYPSRWTSSYLLKSGKETGLSLYLTWSLLTTNPCTQLQLENGDKAEAYTRRGPEEQNAKVPCQRP